LEAYFSDSVNSDLKPCERSASLNNLKTLLASLDAHYSQAVIRELGKRKKEISATKSLSTEAAKSKPQSMGNHVSVNRPTEKPLPPQVTQLFISPDTSTPTLSASLHTRGSCRVVCDVNDCFLPSTLKRQFDDRLQRWDPFWTVQNDLSSVSINGFTKGYRTTLVTKVEPSHLSPQPKIVSRISFSLSSDKSGVSWGTHATPKDGQRRLLFRSLPLPPPPATHYRADTHLFPKGTFLQINRGPLRTLQQRKQQSHDESLWKGNCGVLDITSNVKNITATNELELACYDDGRYALQVAVCEYRGPEALLVEMKKSMPVIPYEQAMNEAKSYLNCQTVVLDDDDDDDVDASNNVSLTFSLDCPFSKKPMQTPVRGKACKHMQCFDLLNFLSSNSFPSARRWRCVCCEAFVSVEDLVICGLFQRMLERYSGGGRVMFQGNGTWTAFKESEKKRRGAVSEEEEEKLKRRRKGPAPEEIIVL